MFIISRVYENLMLHQKINKIIGNGMPIWQYVSELDNWLLVVTAVAYPALGVKTTCCSMLMVFRLTLLKPFLAIILKRRENNNGTKR